MIAISGLVVVHIIPHAMEAAGAWALGVALLGFLGPGLVERSLAGDVVSPVRTSRQAWCQPGIATECYNHPLTRRVAERVANLTGVPVVNSEFFQVLR